MKTIVIDYEPRYFQSVVGAIQSNCPQINFKGVATSCDEALKLIEQQQPSLIFMEVDMPEFNAFDILKSTTNSNFETIFFSHSSEKAIEAIKYQACGYVLKPLNVKDVLLAIEVAELRIQSKLENSDSVTSDDNEVLFPDNIIGIPTMEGFEFISIDEIIRCEGYQRCTRIITPDRSDIISSYHIGVFRKRLSSRSFYSTHKSHLINLRHIRSYHKEGTIRMSDGACVPVSKRRKGEFLNLLMQSR